MKCLLFGALALAVAAGAERGQAQSYVLTDLGTLGGASSSANGLSPTGQVVGTSQDAAGNSLPFVWANGVMQPIGTQPGVAYAINSSGLVTGSLSGTNGNSTAFVASGGTVTPITGYASGVAVNASGQVLMLQTNAFNSRSAIWSGGTVGSSLPLLGSSINDAGVVAGFFVPSTRPHAATYFNGALADRSAGIAGPSTYAAAINASGQLAVYSQTTLLFSSYIVTGTTVTPIGSLSSNGLDNTMIAGLNSTGFAVGASAPVGGGTSPPTHAFLFDGTNIFDLNNLISSGSGWTLTNASAINDAGQIVGFGTINGVRHAFLLNPIPEPSALALTGAALLSGVLLRRRRA